MPKQKKSAENLLQDLLKLEKRRGSDYQEIKKCISTDKLVFLDNKVKSFTYEFEFQTVYGDGSEVQKELVLQLRKKAEKGSELQTAIDQYDMESKKIRKFERQRKVILSDIEKLVNSTSPFIVDAKHKNELVQIRKDLFETLCEDDELGVLAEEVKEWESKTKVKMQHIVQMTQLKTTLYSTMQKDILTLQANNNYKLYNRLENIKGALSRFEVNDLTTPDHFSTLLNDWKGAMIMGKSNHQMFADTHGFFCIPKANHLGMLQGYDVIIASYKDPPPDAQQAVANR